MQAWLASVSDDAVRTLDLALIQDLLRIEGEPAAWRAIAAVATDEIERRTLLGDVATAQTLLNMLVAERSDGGRAALRPAAESMLNKLAAGQIVRHIVFHLRKAEEQNIEPLTRVCHTIGPGVVRPSRLPWPRKKTTARFAISGSCCSGSAPRDASPSNS